MISAHCAYDLGRFWWLGPGEQLEEEGGGAWPHGAFVYLYREEARANDCFLSLAELEDA